MVGVSGKVAAVKMKSKGQIGAISGAQSFILPTGTVPEKPAGEKALKIRLEVCRASQNGY